MFYANRYNTNKNLRDDEYTMALILSNLPYMKIPAIHRMFNARLNACSDMIVEGRVIEHYRKAQVYKYEPMELPDEVLRQADRRLMSELKLTWL